MVIVDLKEPLLFWANEGLEMVFLTVQTEAFSPNITMKDWIR